MRKIFKVVTVLTVMVLMSFAFFGCKKDADGAKQSINVYLPDGAPSLALAELMNNNSNLANYKVNYYVVPGDQIVAKVTNNEADIAIIPTNAAAILYNKGTPIKYVSANVFGLMYMVSKNAVNSPEDLKGQIVYNIGQGNTPDLTFRYILNYYNIPYEISDVKIPGKVALKFVSEASELIPLLKTGTAEYGIMGEPAVSQAISMVTGLQNVMDIQSEWKKATGLTESYPQAGLIIKNSLIESDPEIIEDIINKAVSSAEWIKTYPTLAGIAIKDKGSLLTAEFTTEIITRCNVRVIKAEEGKIAINTYLTALYNMEPKTVGGKVPDDGFYYKAN